MSIATKCTCGYSITGVCTSSVKECRQLRKENTQLPKEVVEQISKEVDILFDDTMDSGTSLPMFQKLTVYATQLHQAQQENAELKKQLDQWQVDFRRVQYEAINYANRKEEIEKQREEALTEVSILKAQPGAVWVKGVKGFPVKKIVVAKFKHYDDPLRGWVIGHASSSTGEMITFDWGVSSITLQMDHPRWEILYWLDESATPAAGREEAVEFAEWAGWDWRRVEGKNMWENQKTLEVLKSTELYEKYKRQCKTTGKE